MLRLLIIAGLIYLLYRAFKSWMIKVGHRSDGSVDGGDRGAIDDIMVKDPQCHVYFPKRKAVQAAADGEELYFCSAECRDKYLLEKTPAEPGNSK